MRISTAICEQLASHYDSGVVSEISKEWEHAPLNDRSGLSLPYGRFSVDSNAGQRPVVFVNGFSEGLHAKAPFLAEMVQAGFDITMADQQRLGMPKNEAGKKCATDALATGLLAVLAQEDLLGGGIDVVTHSYGSLVFDAMSKISQAGGLAPFAGSRVVMLAPGGINPRESLPKLGFRFAKSLVSENSTPKDHLDETGEMFKAGKRNIQANVIRSAREVLDLAKKRVDFEGIRQGGVSSIAVLGYAADRLFPHRVLDGGVQDQLEAGVVYATPISLMGSQDGPIRSGDFATHNDEQFNPERVVGSLRQLLET